MKKWMLIGFMMITGLSFGQGSLGEIVGTVIDNKSNDTLIGAQVFVIDQDRKYQALTDLDGRFRITAIPAGEYLLHVKYSFDTMPGITVRVPMDGIYNTGIIRFIKTKELDGIIVTAKSNRIRLEYGSLPIKELTQEEIEKSPVKFSIANLATSMSSEVKMSEDGELMFRGARKGDMIYLLDGVKSSEISNIPSASIGRMMVYTGGLPAKYGDTLGGAVVVETLGYFDLYRAWQSAEMKKNPN